MTPSVWRASLKGSSLRRLGLSIGPFGLLEVLVEISIHHSENPACPRVSLSQRRHAETRERSCLVPGLQSEKTRLEYDPNKRQWQMWCQPIRQERGQVNQANETNHPLVGIIMGSKSDWPTMENASNVLNQFDIAHECKVVSAHRTPEWMVDYAKSADQRGLKVIIAGAGGAAHLPGMVASMTRLPVLGVPVQSRALSGLDSLLSIVQMPKGVPVGTLAIGESGARNAGLLAARILGIEDSKIAEAVNQFMKEQTNAVLKETEL